MFFGDKYGDKVNVIQFGEFSKEFCGGTHILNTSDIKYFKIVSESSIASGVRRIEAVTGFGVLKYLEEIENNISELNSKVDETSISIKKLHGKLSKSDQHNKKDNDSSSNVSSPQNEELEKLKEIFSSDSLVDVDEVKHFISVQEHLNQKLSNELVRLNDEKRKLEKELSGLELKSKLGGIDSILNSPTEVKGIQLFRGKVNASNMDELKSMGDELRNKMKSGVGVLISPFEEKVGIVCVVSDDLIKEKKIMAGKIVGSVAKIVGGGGGGRPHLATAGGRDIAKIDEALEKTEEIIYNLQ
jgi:alanyl-tRNA synthetase